MNEIFLIFLSMSVSGSFLSLIILAIKPFIKSRVSQQWQYYIWLIVILRFTLPITPQVSITGELIRGMQNMINSSEASKVTADVINGESSLPDSSNVTQVTQLLQNITSEEVLHDETTPQNDTLAYDYKANILSNIWILWLNIALMLLMHKTTSYRSFVRYVKIGAKRITDPRVLDIYIEELAAKNIKRQLPIYENDQIVSPMLIGIIRPAVVIPYLEISDGEMRNIIRHELSHYTHMDFVYKWIVEITLCFHWFNPIIYLVSKHIQKSCELSCDEAVIRNLDGNSRIIYGDALISSLKSQKSYNSFVVSMTMSDNINLVKERLDMIMRYEKKSKSIVYVTIILTMFIFSCFNITGAYAVTVPNTNNPVTNTIAPAAVSVATETLKQFSDVRAVFDGDKKIYEPSEFKMEDIITFTFNENTVLKGWEGLQKQIMDNGKNPGLGIRELHKQGVTGKGVNVAIIDQNLLLNHPEFKGKIVEYYDTGCNQPADRGSMHAPAVTSILAGNTIGVAPDARIYFAAVPTWNGDSEYFAKAMYWIIEKNKNLSESDRIRVVSISAAPSGNGSPFEKNQELYVEAVAAAQKEGILVLDCRSGESTGIIGPGLYNLGNPEKPREAFVGFPSRAADQPRFKYKIFVPTSFRTVAEEYTEGSPSYQYTGEGGLSWGIPYAAGVLALGWQVNPTLSNSEIIQILTDTGAVNRQGYKFVNPEVFIKKCQEMK